MLNKNEYSFIYQHAYVPEHLPDYVQSVSKLTPHLIDNYLCYSRKKHLLFIGYPLGIQTGDTSLVFQNACEKFNPSSISVITPEPWYKEIPVDWQPDDYYYQLELPVEKPSPELSYMIRRARKAVNVSEGMLKKEHKKIINEFIEGHDLSKEQIDLFNKIPHYLKNSCTARLIEATCEDGIAAFSVVDLGATDTAFYMFHFRSPHMDVPGASDLLFWEMVLLAQSNGKRP